MDRPLKSSRDHPYGPGGGGGGGGGGYGDRDRYRGGGGHYGGGGYRGRGRGRGRGGYRRGRGRGRGGGRHYHHRNQNRNQQHNDGYEDPNARLVKQLSAMVSRVGEFKRPQDSNADMPPEAVASLRPVVLAGAKNISDLTKVVAKASNVATFLKFIPPPPPRTENTGFGFTRPPPKPEDQAGPMAHLIVSCAATLPLQTPSYAALTLSVHAHSNHHTDYAGFANRCVTYTLQRLSCDMDTLFCDAALERPKVACRIKLLFRYLAMLGRLKVIQGQDDGESENPPEEEKSYSLVGFLHRLVEAALAATPTEDAFAPTSSSNAAAPLTLAYFVLSTIPYLLSFVPADVIQEQLMEPLQTLLGAYASSFTPGVGITAILLKEEQLEAADDEEEEEEDDEDDDDDEEGASEVVCDSLQDLYRSVQFLVKEHADLKPPASRFALLTDEPWKGILGPEAPPPAPPQDTGMDTGESNSVPVKYEEGVPAMKTENDDAMAAEPAPGAESTGTDGAPSTPQDPPAPPAPPGPLENPDPPMRLKLPEGGFQCLKVMLNPHGDPGEDVEGNNASSTTIKIQAFPLEIVVFGRLPIFGGPKPVAAEGEGGDDDDMDDEDAPANDQVAAYGKDFGMLDRCFMADAIRDLLCCHESSVSLTGLERGSAKSVAEQLWSLGHIFSTQSEDAAAPTGLEYGILEAMLSLILQSSSSSTFRQIFLSRVLLELTRLQPALVSPALALAASNLFQDYIPALVPTARHNLSCWLAFHLVNTDYQWPAAYWTHWQTYTTDSSKLHSRGSVVKTTLQFLMENVNNPRIVIKDCLPSECEGLSGIVVAPLPPAETIEGVLQTVQKDIQRRIWDDDEHPESLKGYVVGDELAEVLASNPLDSSSSLKRVWCRSGSVMRSLLQPLEREHQRLLAAAEQAQKKATENGGGDEDDNAMDEDDDCSEDTMVVMQEALARYGPVLLACIGKDKEVLEQSLQGSEKDSSLISTCESYLLNTLSAKACFSRSVLEGCLDCLLRQACVVSSSGVLHWVLGDIPGGDEQEQEKHKVLERWWEFAADAIRVEIAKKKSEKNEPAPLEAGGMVIDRTGEGGIDAQPQENSGEASRTLTLVESISPLLDYVVRRACTLLSEQGDDPQQGNKLKPHQVDLVEGVKSTVRAAFALLFSELRASNENDKGTSEREIQDALSQSAMTGWKLAGVCEEFSGSNAINVLRESLRTV